MFQPVSLFIGLRYSRSKSRTGFVSFITFFSITGILLGVASLITVVSVMNGFEGELKKRILGIVPHVVVSSPQSSFNDWQTIQQQLLSLPLVSHVTPIIESEALVLSDKGLQGVIMQGIIPELEQHNLVNSHLTSGNLTVLNDRAYAVVIGQSLARKLDVRIGEKINLVLPNKTRFTPMGRVPMQRSFTIADVFNVGSPVDNSAVYVHSHYAAKMMREKEGSVSALRIYLTDAFSVGLFIKQLPIAFAAFDILPWSESQGALFAAVGMEKNMMWLMLSLIIAVAAFNIISALVMVVINKQGEIAILQTFGMNRANVFKIFITQGMINGLWGVFLGSIIGMLLTFNLNELLSVMGISILGTGMSDNSLPIDFQLRDIMTIIFSSLSMSLLATLYPAYRASLTQPAEVLRHE
jgi:lipoprotein-releasing system permease protein